MIKAILQTALVSLIATILLALGVYNFMPFSIDEIGGEEMLGSTITTINGSDKLKDSRSVINTNFTNLNNDKLEVSDFNATTSLPQITTLSNLSTIGTITSGIWNSTNIGVPYGGTGASSFSKYHLLMGNDTGALNVVATGTEGQILSITGGVPSWEDGSVNEALNYTWTGNHSFNATTTFNASTTWNILPEYTFNAINEDEAVRYYMIATRATSTLATSTLIINADTEENGDFVTYTKIKEFCLGNYGTTNITFDMKSNNGVDFAYGRIYKNDVAVGTERTTGSTSYTTYQETFIVEPGDCFSLYTKEDPGTANPVLKNFRAYADGVKSPFVIED